MLYTLGVDPGKTGALAWLDDTGLIAHIEDMPDATGAALGAHLRDLFVEHRPAVAWVEQVHAMPGQGVSSMFTFGQGYGVLLGALGAWSVPVRHVTPAAWKRALGLSKNKTASRQRAVELWPDDSHRFARVKDDGRAEAALIAWHGQLEQRAGAA